MQKTVVNEESAHQNGSAQGISPEEAGLEPIRPEPSRDDSWPRSIAEEAGIGLPGKFLRAVEPVTEADPNALLVHFLSAAGNLLGNRLHLLIGRSRHALKI